MIGAAHCTNKTNAIEANPFWSILKIRLYHLRMAITLQQIVKYNYFIYIALQGFVVAVCFQQTMGVMCMCFMCWVENKVTSPTVTSAITITLTTALVPRSTA